MNLSNIQFVVEHSSFVTIDEESLQSFARSLDLDHWLKQDLFKDDPLANQDDQLQLIFLFNCLNFCFWQEPKWSIESHGNTFSGSQAMFHVLKDACVDNPQLLKATYLSTISESECAKILQNPPLLKERWNNLREAGNVLNTHFEGSFRTLLKKGEFDTSKILSLIVKYFFQYQDEAVYKGTRIEFYKRAQLVISMASKVVPITGLEKLTAFADYRIPQLLRQRSIFRYSKTLAEKVDSGFLIPAGSEEEIEIRAYTIWAVELIKNELAQKKNRNLSSMDIDNILWTMSKMEPMKGHHHKTVSVFY